MAIFGIKLVNIRFLIEFNVSVALMGKISNFPLNSIHVKQAHYFHDINYYMLKKINCHSEGGGHRSMSTPLNTPLLPTLLFLLAIYVRYPEEIEIIL